MFLALLYGASPLDLIPDLIPILGLSDDLAVLLIGSVMVFRALRALKSHRRGVTKPQTVSNPQGTSGRQVHQSKPNRVIRYELP